MTTLMSPLLSRSGREGLLCKLQIERSAVGSEAETWALAPWVLDLSALAPAARVSSALASVLVSSLHLSASSAWGSLADFRRASAVSVWATEVRARRAIQERALARARRAAPKSVLAPRSTLARVRRRAASHTVATLRRVAHLTRPGRRNLAQARSHGLAAAPEAADATLAAHSAGDVPSLADATDTDSASETASGTTGLAMEASVTVL